MLWSYPVGPCNPKSEAGGSELEKLGQSYAIAARRPGDEEWRQPMEFGKGKEQTVPKRLQK